MKTEPVRMTLAGILLFLAAVFSYGQDRDTLDVGDMNIRETPFTAPLAAFPEKLTVPYGSLTVPGFLPSGAAGQSIVMPGTGVVPYPRALWNVGIGVYRSDSIIYGIATSRLAGISATYNFNDHFFMQTGLLGSFINGNINIYRPGYYTSFGYNPNPNMKIQVWGQYFSMPVLPYAHPGNMLMQNTGIGASGEFRINGNFKIGISAGVNRID